MLLYFALVLGLVAGVLGRTSPPNGALIVGKGHYPTIQSAVDALNDTEKEQIIFINPGTYYEQVTIDNIHGPLKMYGYSNKPSSYTENEVTIIAGHSQKDRPHNESTATLRCKTDNLKIYNINVVNSFGEGSQALALSAYKKNQGFYACSFKGFQDTILTQEGAQLFSKCYIEGATDFIFGQGPIAWFEKCTIGVVPASVAYITASGRDSDDSPSWFVFNNTKIRPAKGKDVKAETAYLGRPWRGYARVAYQHCSMSGIVKPEGWSLWSDKDPRNNDLHFYEFDNTGPGAQGPRAKFSSKLQKELKMADILGANYEKEYYFDKSYVD